MDASENSVILSPKLKKRQADNTLMRSFSCVQIFQEDKYGRTFQTTHMRVSSFVSPMKSIPAKQYLRREGEGDHRSWSAPKRLRSQNSLYVKPKRAKMLTYPDEVKNADKAGFKSSLFAINTFIFSLVILYLSYHLYFYFAQPGCAEIWDMNKTTSELKSLVLGQNEAMRELIAALNKLEFGSGSVIISFSGSVGVGKTYVSSIISQNFPSSQHLKSFSSLLPDLRKNIPSLSSSACNYNLLVLDDIAASDSAEALHLVELLVKQLQKDQKLIVIMIFEKHTTEDENLLQLILKESTLQIYHIPFMDLNSEVVHQCFIRECQRLKVHIPESEMSTLVNEHMEFIDVVKGTPGCKGVSDVVSSFYV